jgi:hypothetical protein
MHKPPTYTFEVLGEPDPSYLRIHGAPDRRAAHVAAFRLAMSDGGLMSVETVPEGAEVRDRLHPDHRESRPLCPPSDHSWLTWKGRRWACGAYGAWSETCPPPLLPRETWVPASKMSSAAGRLSAEAQQEGRPLSGPRLCRTGNSLLPLPHPILVYRGHPDGAVWLALWLGWSLPLGCELRSGPTRLSAVRAYLGGELVAMVMPLRPDTEAPCTA